MQHLTAKVGDLTLHFVEALPSPHATAGPPVLLLHGFPEFWYSWRHQLPALALAGRRAMALDLRGYNDSDCPSGVHNYRMQALVDDVAGLIDEQCGGQADVVGHDWGGVIAWRLAALRPELVRRLAILNAPHPAAYSQVLRQTPSQWLRSSYVAWFQVPWLAEQSIQAGNFWLLERALRQQPANQAAFSDDDVLQYKQALAKPGRLTAGLNYYRAAMQYRQDIWGEPQTVAAPTLVVWGMHDPFLSALLCDTLAPWVPRLQVVRIETASHWVQNESPGEVNQALVGFLGQG